jgi:tetratricopeptide (TPR) repeat protein
MDCPRCGATEIDTPDCPRCGVILARALAPRPPRPPAPPLPPPRPAWRSLVLPLLGLAAVAAAAAVSLRREDPPPRRATAGLPATPPAAAGDVAAGADEAEAPGDPPTPTLPPGDAWLESHPGLPEPRLASDNARHAEALAARARLARRLEAGDWPAAEDEARALAALVPEDAGAVRSLAFALFRQGRSREARDLLAPFLERHPDREGEALLERIRGEAGREASLDEARLAHFRVRYDGEAHEAVGREVLRALERHYATLVRAFDHRPRAPIPVVLLSRRSYHEATGAPGWSGGQYDAFDGRVRVPIGGLTPELTPELDATLVHELTHAFVEDISRGVAPREVHEGLAQLVEGRRVADLLGEEDLRALADGRLGGVRGFYASSLSFAEHLVAERGQGGVNDLLRAMAETGSADEAFRRVYGRDLAGVRRDWSARLRLRHGS